MHMKLSPRNPERRPDPDSGFTLVELLIVISIVVILMLVLIPQLSSARIAGNETAARADLRNITAAELSYSTSFPEKGFTCNLADLTGGATPFLDKNLAGGVQAGYSFAFSGCVSKGNTVNYYQILAQPVSVGKTGRASFCTDPDGAITTDATGGSNCLHASPTTAPKPAATDGGDGSDSGGDAGGSGSTPPTQ
jgi:type IV pilus assembly protein PilA